MVTWSKGAERLYGWTADQVLGRGIRQVLPMAASEAERDARRRRLETQGRMRVEMTAYRKDGTPVEVETINAAARDDTGRITGYFGIHRDLTERRVTEDEREELARRQALVAELGLRALGSDDLQPLLDDAVAVVARTLDADLTSVVEILPGRDELLLRAGFGWEEGEVGRGTGPAGSGSLVGHMVEVGVPVVSHNLPDDPRFEISPLLAAHEPVSGAAVVIGGRREAFGGLGAFACQPREFTRATSTSCNRSPTCSPRPSSGWSRNGP